MEIRKRQLMKNTVILAIGKVCVQFVNFFMLPFYTGLLAKEEFGIFDLFQTYIILLVPIVTLQLDMGLFRFLLETREDQRGKGELLTSVVIFLSLSCGLFFLFYGVLTRAIDFEYSGYLLILIILNAISAILLQFARGQGDNVSYAIASFFTAFITVSLNVVFIAVLHIGITGMFWASIGGQCAAIVYLTISQRALHYFHFRNYNKRLLKSVLKYSLPLIPANLSWWVISASDRSIISVIMNVGANGIFAVASKFSGLVIVFFNIFNMAWTETVSLHINDIDRDSFLSATINEIYRAFFSICIIAVAIMPFLFPVLINEQYHEAYGLIPILMLAAFAQIMCGMWSVIFIAQKNTLENAKTAFLAALINVIIDVLLIQSIGLYAAAGSTLVAFMIMAIYRYIGVQKYVNIRLESKMVVLSMLVFLLVCFGYYQNEFTLRLILLIASAIFTIAFNRKSLAGVLRILKHIAICLLRKDTSDRKGEIQ